MSVARLAGVGVRRGDEQLLDGVDLDVDDHVVVMGPNGSGKTTVLRLLSTHLFPTVGSVELLGHRYGEVDLRTLRARVGIASSGTDDLLHRGCSAEVLVGAALHGAKRPVPLSDGDLAHARSALAGIGAAHLCERVTATLSVGEWQRVRIARALVTDPDLLLLDEPFTGLDVAGRERLLQDLDTLLSTSDGPTVVLVTHHVEEIPTGIPSAALLRDGRLVATGPTDEVLTSGNLSRAFGLDVEVHRRDGRYHAVARR